MYEEMHTQTETRTDPQPMDLPLPIDMEVVSTFVHVCLLEFSWRRTTFKSDFEYVTCKDT